MKSILLFAALFCASTLLAQDKATMPTLKSLGKQISGDPITQEDLEGKIVVIHLWEAH